MNTAQIVYWPYAYGRNSTTRFGRGTNIKKIC